MQLKYSVLQHRRHRRTTGDLPKGTLPRTHLPADSESSTHAAGPAVVVVNAAKYMLSGHRVTMIRWRRVDDVSGCSQRSLIGVRKPEARAGSRHSLSDQAIRARTLALRTAQQAASR